MTNPISGLTNEEAREIAEARKAELLSVFTANHSKIMPIYKKLPSGMQSLFLKVICGNPSMRERIKLKCYECNGWQKHLAESCPDESCALWKERPGQ